MSASTLAGVLRPVRRGVLAAVRTARTRLGHLATLLARERRSLGIQMPLSRRLWLWRHGFTSRSHALFDVTPATRRDYLSDLQHERANDIGSQWDAVVNNKLTFQLLFGAFPDRLPDLYGVVYGGRVYRDYPGVVAPPHAGDQRASDPVEATADGGVGGTGAVPGDDATAGEWVAAALDAAGTLVCKPVYGSGGRDVLVCRRTADGYHVNGDRHSRSAFVDRVCALDCALVTAYVEQADYAARLFPDAANTLRVLTLWDPETDEPFVAGVVQRIGTRRSAPVDNWSRGGLSAAVREDGTLSAGAQWRSDRGVVRWYESHPDTGAQIEGTAVPDWPEIRSGVLELARTVPYLPRVGWDVLPTGDGEFVVFEANAHAATRTVQVHRPLLRDPRVRRFYEHHDCL
jgi:hypothetical protein